MHNEKPKWLSCKQDNEGSLMIWAVNNVLFEVSKTTLLRTPKRKWRWSLPWSQINQKEKYFTKYGIDTLSMMRATLQMSWLIQHFRQKLRIVFSIYSMRYQIHSPNRCSLVAGSCSHWFHPCNVFCPEELLLHMVLSPPLHIHLAQMESIMVSLRRLIT